MSKWYVVLNKIDADAIILRCKHGIEAHMGHMGGVDELRYILTKKCKECGDSCTETKGGVRHATN